MGLILWTSAFQHLGVVFSIDLYSDVVALQFREELGALREFPVAYWGGIN